MLCCGWCWFCLWFMYFCVLCFEFVFCFFVCVSCLWFWSCFVCGCVLFVLVCFSPPLLLLRLFFSLPPLLLFLDSSFSFVLSSASSSSSLSLSSLPLSRLFVLFFSPLLSLSLSQAADKDNPYMKSNASFRIVNAEYTAHSPLTAMQYVAVSRRVNHRACGPRSQNVRSWHA